MQIEGKRILVSGATGGLGTAIAHRLASEGAALVLSARNRDALEALAGELPGGATTHQVVESDLTEPDAPERLIDASGDLDGLIANAALPGTGRLESFSDDELRRAIAHKNMLFFHRWRPANETYLFLFRRHEQGNNAVEVSQFDPLVDAAEARIHDLVRPPADSRP